MYDCQKHVVDVVAKKEGIYRDVQCTNAQMLFEKFWDGGVPEEASVGSGSAESSVETAVPAGRGGDSVPAAPTKRKATSLVGASLP